MDLDILFENDHVLVVNKPAGLITHPDGKTDEPSVSEWFVARHPNLDVVGESLVLPDGSTLKKPGIVHRLDRDTSGVLVLAKDQDTFIYLKTQFQARSVQKTYHAFVYGHVKEDEGLIDRPLGRSAKHFWLWSAQRGARGKLREAQTGYKVIERGKETTYMELSPKTGRTHQLRAHLKAINHPIVCDALYAPKHDCLLGFNRVALHASSIVIDISEGETKVFEAPLPQDFIYAKGLFKG